MNGAYCKRIQRILAILGRRVTAIDYEEREPVRAADIDAALKKDASITHVALVHCETSTGALNPWPTSPAWSPDTRRACSSTP